MADVPGQGMAARDAKLKIDNIAVEILQEMSTHKFANIMVDTYNSCTHDLPPVGKK